MSGVRVSDAASAQLAARRQLEAQYGANRIERVVFTRAWYVTGGFCSTILCMKVSMSMMSGLSLKRGRHRSSMRWLRSALLTQRS